MLLITLSGHTNWAPTIAKLGFSVMCCALADFSCALTASTTVLSALRTALRLFFLGGDFPTCSTSNLPPPSNAVGLQHMQHVEFNPSWTIEPPKDVSIAALKQFSCSVQRDLSVGSLMFSTSPVISMWALAWQPLHPARPHNYQTELRHKIFLLQLSYTWYNWVTVSGRPYIITSSTSGISMPYILRRLTNQ